MLILSRVDSGCFLFRLLAVEESYLWKSWPIFSGKIRSLILPLVDALITYLSYIDNLACFHPILVSDNDCLNSLIALLSIGAYIIFLHFFEQIKLV